LSKPRHFRVLKWERLPPGTRTMMVYDLRCDCGREALCPVADVGVHIEGRISLSFVVDPATPAPDYFMPEVFKCPKCGRIYGEKPEKKQTESQAEPEPAPATTP